MYIFMTKNRLNKLYYINGAIDADKRKLAELEVAATSVTGNISGLPHTKGFIRSDRTALAADIADLKKKIRNKIRSSEREFIKLNKYIYSIKDPFISRIINLRHIDGLTWNQIAEIMGGNNTENSVRMAYNRFVDHENKN